MTIGQLQTSQPIEKAMSEIKDWLDKINVSGMNLDIKYDAKMNIALVRFPYIGKNYEFTSNKQKNCRLNMWAIARVMEYKIRAHLMGIEPFQKSMIAYVQIGASEEAIQKGYQNINNTQVNDSEEKQLCLQLGISHLASNAELIQHYKKLAKSWHPDMAGSEEAKKSFEEKFGEINVCWEKLKKIRNI